jgi:ADP-L-glycero-D-manno-heptose 6-epimerase
MRYLVTGAAGFIGARFVESCNKKKIELISVDKLANFSRPEHASLDFGMKFDIEDISQHLLNDAPRHIDAIIHLGAITDTTASDLYALRKLNTEFSHWLWQYASQYQVPFVYASSAATYGASETFDDSEEELQNLAPLNLYGSSKHAFDLLALKLEKEGVMPPSWAGFKFFNVYGYGEAHKGRMASMVYQALKQIKETGKIVLFQSHNEEYDDGMLSRDFIHVNDVVHVLHWATTKCPRGIYNLGTGVSSTFLDLTFAAFEALELFPKIEWVDTPEDIRDQYQYYTKADISKLRDAGYRSPFTKLKSGIWTYAARLKA